MSPSERLTDLLVRWQEEFETGRDVPAAELCRDDRTLLPEIEARLADLRKFMRLAKDIFESIEPVGQAPPTAASPPGTPISFGYDPAQGIASDAPSSLPQLPNYEILGVLGRGGMGIVYKARQTGLNRIVALKMLRYGVQASPEEHARFRTEAEAIGRLQHRHIVQIFELGEWRPGNSAPSMPYFAMEFVPGGSLENIAAQGPHAPAAAARLIMLLARAVHAAHNAGVIHRDLKPANVLLAAPADESALNTVWGCPKVSDFGLARLGEPSGSGSAGATAAGALLGTPDYMAPEQAEGRIKDIGPASDVWALGVILYELLAGRRPFQSESLTKTLHNICAVEPPPLNALQPDVPLGIETIMRRCLQKASADRYPSAAALANDLKSWLADETTDWQPTPAPIVNPQRVTAPLAMRLTLGCWEFMIELKRRPRMMLAMLFSVVLVVALGSIGIWLLNRLHDARPIQDPVVVPVTRPPFKGWIDILVSEPNNKKRQLLRLHEAGTRPLRPGDEVRVEVALKEHPGFVYVLWIDAKGKVIPIYPWQDLDWGKLPTKEKQVSGRLMLPADGGIYPIERSPEGLETVVMLARETPLPASVDLSKLLGDLGDQTGTDREYVRWFENGQVVTSEPDRAPGGRAEASDPAERTQARIQQRLGEHFTFNRAVSFFNLGK